MVDMLKCDTLGQQEMVSLASTGFNKLMHQNPVEMDLDRDTGKIDGVFCVCVVKVWNVCVLGQWCVCGGGFSVVSSHTKP